mgnify:CR=1 FL=1
MDQVTGGLGCHVEPPCHPFVERPGTIQTGQLHQIRSAHQSQLLCPQHGDVGFQAEETLLDIISSEAVSGVDLCIEHMFVIPDRTDISRPLTGL